MKTERHFIALKGKTLVTNNNKSYQLDYNKIGMKIIPVIVYNGNRMQVSMRDYCNVPTDVFINAIEQELTVI